jgi:hypothetical protein
VAVGAFVVEVGVAVEFEEHDARAMTVRLRAPTMR